MGKYSGYWEMREGSRKASREVFKCTGCGATTEHPAGFDGEPDVSHCAAHCPNAAGDWRPGNRGDRYRVNFARIFPRSPGARA